MMDLKKALQILNLNENYTEEDLKKAYRKLIVKYHPDKHPEDKKSYAEKKTKEINEAKDILEKNLKNFNNQSSNNNNNYQSNKQSNNQTNKTNKEEYIKILKKFEKEIIYETNTIEKITPIDKLFNQNKFKLISILHEFSYRVPTTTNISEIKKEYQLFRNEYVDALVNYYIEFTKTSHIYTDIWTIHYSDTLNEVRNLMYRSIENILQEELSKFPCSSYFFNPSPKINPIKEKYILTCLYGYGEIETIKKAFNDDITLDFKKYQKRRNIINELKSSLPSNKVHIIIDLESTIYNEEHFYQIYSQIDTLSKIKSKVKNSLVNFKIK